METINQTFHNASTALWEGIESLRLTGERDDDQQPETDQPHGEEPISGIQGKGTVTDPYDAGNREDQPGSPADKENTAVIPESLASITPPEPESQSLPQPDDHPSKSGVALGATSGPEQATATHTTTTTTATATPPTSVDIDDTLDKKEQRSEPANPSQETQPASSSVETTTLHGSSGANGKQKVSEEALKGPKCPPPREPYEFEKEMEERQRKKKEEGHGPKPGGMMGMGDPSQQTGEDNGSGNHVNESSHIPTHHHKSLKERLGKVVRVGNHLHHSNRGN